MTMRVAFCPRRISFVRAYASNIPGRAKPQGLILYYYIIFLNVKQTNKQNKLINLLTYLLTYLLLRHLLS